MLDKKYDRFRFDEDDNEVKPKIRIDESPSERNIPQNRGKNKNQNFRWVKEEEENSSDSDFSSEEKKKLVPFHEQNHIGFVASKLNFRNMAMKLNTLKEDEEDIDARFLSNQRKMEGKILFHLDGQFLKYWNILNSLLVVIFNIKFSSILLLFCLQNLASFHQFTLCGI